MNEALTLRFVVSFVVGVGSVFADGRGAEVLRTTCSLLINIGFLMLGMIIGLRRLPTDCCSSLPLQYRDGRPMSNEEPNRKSREFPGGDASPFAVERIEK